VKFSETTASHCRYGGHAEEIWGDWQVLWEYSIADYQGSARFLAAKNGRFAYYEWNYGSCSGCDSWEAAGTSDADICEEMKRDALWFTNRAEVDAWLLQRSTSSTDAADMMHALRNVCPHCGRGKDDHANSGKCFYEPTTWKEMET
jgi:hypothetical protein